MKTVVEPGTLVRLTWLSVVTFGIACFAFGVTLGALAMLVATR